MAVPFVPRFRLHLAEQLGPLWQATEWRAAAPQPPPFWAVAWPGSPAVGRFLLGEPALMQGPGVRAFGAGGGRAASAAAHAGATHVRACERDPGAVTAP